MSLLVPRGRSRFLLATAVIALVFGATEPSLGEAVLRHSPPPCLDTDAFPLIEARVPLAAEASPERLAVRFRAEADPDWYEIELSRSEDGVFRAALPKPLPETVRVAYVIEGEDGALRTEEYLVNVLAGGCPGARSAPAELAEDIRVRRTSSEQSELPPGFSPDGIRPGGSPSRTTLGILAGAAGGAGIAGLVVTGDEPVPEPPDVDSPEAIRACFSPDPIPDIESGETIRFDASCTRPETVTSYLWDFGDGTTGQGSSVEHLFEPGGIYQVRLTVSDGQRTDNKSRLVRVLATPTACFITSPDPPRIAVNGSIDFNADCSVGDRDGGPSRITTYAWDFGDGRPGAEGRFVSRQFPRADLYGVTLTVTNEDGRQDQTTQFVVVEAPTARSDTEVGFTAALELSAGSSAQISLNDQATAAIDAPSPRSFRLRARRGENVVEARLLVPADAPGRWRFDFRAAPGFVPGSLRVDRGDVLALDAHGVVFHLSEGDASRVRFRFRLEE